MSVERADVGFDPEAPPCRQWLDSDGAVCAYGYTSDGQHWLHIPGVATYRFSFTGGNVVAYPIAGASLSAVRDAYARAVLPHVLQAQGQEVLHASAVVTATGVVGFCACSGTGKSTIAHRLSKRGYVPLSDDFLVLERRGDGDWGVVPFPFRLRPRGGVDGDPIEDSICQDDANERRLPVAPTSSSLAALFILAKRPRPSTSRSVDIRRLTPATAFTKLLPHAFCFSLEPQERKTRMMESYLDLASGVNAYELSYPDSIDVLPTLLDKVEVIANFGDEVGDVDSGIA